MVGRIKGLSSKEILFQTELYKEMLGMKEVANFKSEKLSGGSKRKLCCAMALIGNPKMLLLDEFTSGIDPISRRNVSEFIKSLN